jgi:hypothetical protein
MKLYCLNNYNVLVDSCAFTDTHTHTHTKDIVGGYLVEKSFKNPNIMLGKSGTGKKCDTIILELGSP